MDGSHLESSQSSRRNSRNGWRHFLTWKRTNIRHKNMWKNMCLWDDGRSLSGSCFSALVWIILSSIKIKGNSCWFQWISRKLQNVGEFVTSYKVVWVFVESLSYSAPSVLVKIVFLALNHKNSHCFTPNSRPTKLATS